MSYTYSSVQCAEMFSSVEEEYSWTDITAKVDLKVAWNLRYALVDDIFLNMRPYPHNIRLYPQSATIVPFAAKYTQAGQSMEYDDFAIVTVQYGIPQGDKDQPEDPVDLVSESLDFTSEIITTDPKGYSWYDETLSKEIRPLNKDEAPGKQVFTATLSRTIFNVIQIPASILSLIGKVNDAAYTSRLLGLTFAEETLLFAPPKTSRAISTAGINAWTLNLTFVYEPNGWNRAWFPDKEKYGVLAVKDPETGALTQHRTYPTASFADWLW